TSLRKKGELEPLLKNLGQIIVDEVHHAGCKSYTELLPYFDHIYYRWGFSGSFLRSDSKTLDMWGLLSNVIYEYPATQAIKDGFLTPKEVLVHKVKGYRSFKYQTEYARNYCKNPVLLEKVREVFETYV